MSDWRSFARKGQWAEVDWPDLSKGDRRKFLDMLRRTVPRIEVVNGMERTVRHALPEEVRGIKALEARGVSADDASGLMASILEAAMKGVGIVMRQTRAKLRDGMLEQELMKRGATKEDVDRARDHPPQETVDLEAAAEILALGELEAAVEGPPLQASEEWATIRAEAEKYLRDVLEEPEVTAGATELSRHTHARKTLESLEEVEHLPKLMAGELDTDEGRAWLLEFAAEVASRAFVSGRRMQAAWGKAFEGHAVRGMTTLKSSAKGGAMRRLNLKPVTMKILAEMERLLQRPPSRSVNWAAEAAHSNGFGASPDANRKLWERHRK